MSNRDEMTMSENIWTIMGERMLLPLGWTVPDWSLTFYATDIGYASGTVVLSPGQFYDGKPGWPSDCSTAALCAEANATFPASDGWTSTTTIGDITYHQVVSSYTTRWYFDHDGKVYQFRTDTKSESCTAVVQSVDWTGTRGMVVFLPTGQPVGFDLSQGWSVSCDIWLVPPGGSEDDRVGVSTSCPALFFPSERHMPADVEVEKSPAGQRTVDGITYRGATWTPSDPALGPGFETWDFTFNGREFSLSGDSSLQSTYIESARWRAGGAFKMELDHMELFSHWLKELADTGKAAAQYAEEYIQLKLGSEIAPTTGLPSGAPVMYQLVSVVDSLREEIRLLFLEYYTAFAQSSARIESIVGHVLNENMRGYPHGARVSRDLNYDDDHGPAEIRSTGYSLAAAGDPFEILDVVESVYSGLWEGIGDEEALLYIGNRQGSNPAYPHAYEPGKEWIHVTPDVATVNRPSGWGAAPPRSPLVPIEERKDEYESFQEALRSLSLTTVADYFASSAIGSSPLDYLSRSFAGDWGQVYMIAECLQNLSSYCQYFSDSLDKAISLVFNGWNGREAEAACAYFMRTLAVVNTNTRALGELAALFAEAADVISEHADQVKSGVSLVVDSLIPTPEKFEVASGIVGAVDFVKASIEALVAAENAPSFADRSRGRTTLLKPTAYDVPTVFGR